MAKSATSTTQIEEEIRLAWNHVQIDNNILPKTISVVTESFQTELRKEDDLATAILIGKNIKVKYKGYQTLINSEDGSFASVAEGEYQYKGTCDFNGNNYINTNFYLYSEENIHKNFLISFDIEEKKSGNKDHSTLLSSMNESGSPWPGHNVKTKGNNAVITLESNSNTNTDADVPIPDTVNNVRIIRINDILYYSFDGTKCIQINDYTGFTDTFDVPVTFGAALNGNNEPFRYFKGKLANMFITLLADNDNIENYNPPEKIYRVAYEHKGTYIFNGTSDCINTGLCMFTAENIDKDFEISFNIDSIESGNVNQATLFNAKKEIDPFPAFVYRIYTDNTIRFDSKGGSGSGASNKQADVINKNVKISRINKKMYLSIDDGTPKQVYDFTNFNQFHDVPLTIGASLDSNREPWRYFKGTLSDICIKVLEY